jgi:hypothetical protein
MVSRLIYQSLTALCFAVAILSFAPWASADGDEIDPTCPLAGDHCDKHCPPEKPNDCYVDVDVSNPKLPRNYCHPCKA